MRLCTGSTFGGVAALVLLWGATLPGCSLFSSSPPPVPDSTLTRVLVGMHLSTARAQFDTAAVPRRLADSVLARHGMDSSDLDAALRYYSKRPQAFETLYDGVIDTLRATRQRQSTPADTTQTGR